jgi:hypothetical protein
VDASKLQWQVETDENYRRGTPQLYRLDRVADAGRANWGALATLTDAGLSHGVTPAMVQAEAGRLAKTRPGDIAAIGYVLRLALSTAPDAHLQDAAREAFEAIGGIPLEDTGPAFPDLSVFAVACDRAPSMRALLARTLLRIEDEPGLLTSRPGARPGELQFASQWHLQSDLALTRDAYFGPLLLCLSPAVWALSASRVGGLAIYSLGRAMTGRLSEASELLQLFLHSGAPTGGAIPQLTAAQLEAALTWWTERMNLFLSEVTDLANYVDRAGSYQPRRQFEVLLSVEQLGRRIQSILGNQRDRGTRLDTAFTALDMLDALSFIRFEQACTHARAKGTLNRLEQDLPGDVADVLLVNARRAVDGLRQCQDGFFSPARVGAGTVRVPDKRGREQTLSIENATAQYLRVVRNAHHGFTGKADAGRPRDNALLLAHDGDVPDGVSLLPYLYWLDLVAHPEALRRLLPPRQ